MLSYVGVDLLVKMNQISYAFLTFLFVTCLTINIRLVLCSNETEDTTVSTTAITLTENEVTPGCRCRDNRHLNKDEPGNCSTKSWAFKYGKLWCYVELPSNCNDLKNSTLEPNEKYSAQACSGKGKTIFVVSIKKDITLI